MSVKKQSVAKNATYQMLYNVLTTITPLITTPIISREMGSNNLGIFSFTLTVSHYFTIFAMLGIVNYGTRLIAEANTGICERSRKFWSIYLIQVTMALLCCALYFLYIIVFNPENKSIVVLQSFWIISAVFDISWLFFGMEEFKLTVTRNTFIKLVTVLLIVFLVKRERSPLLTYTAIMAGGNFLSVIALIPLVRGKVKWYKPTLAEVREHIKPILILFIPLLAGVLFGSMDKVMLGGISEYDELGYYYNADRVINIPVGIINGLSTVLFPRISSMLANEKKEEGLIFVNRSFDVVSWLSVLLSFGIAGCAVEFVPLFFGRGFDACVTLIYIMVPILIINAICIFYRMQYLVPFHYDKLYAIGLFLGTIVNLILNAILIPRYKAIGASIATLVAQFVVMMVQFKEREGISVITWLKRVLMYLLIGSTMVFIMRVVSRADINMTIKLVIEVLSGGLIYLSLSTVYWIITGEIKQKISILNK